MFDFLLNFQHLRLCFPTCTTAGDAYFSSKWFHRTVCWWYKCIFSKFDARTESTQSVLASSKFNSALSFTIVMFTPRPVSGHSKSLHFIIDCLGKLKVWNTFFLGSWKVERSWNKFVKFRISHHSLYVSKKIVSLIHLILIHLVC